LQSGVPNDRVASLFDNVVFVDFNYDRCLEQFLFEAVRTRYSLGDAQTKAVLERAKIFHPYGSTGRLPWREQNGALLFGGKLGPDEIIRVASQIRTFTERVVEKTDIELIKSEMQRAELVVFLGF